jgi:hypothetical protein
MDRIIVHGLAFVLHGVASRGAWACICSAWARISQCMGLHLALLFSPEMGPRGMPISAHPLQNLCYVMQHLVFGRESDRQNHCPSMPETHATNQRKETEHWTLTLAAAHQFAGLGPWGSQIPLPDEDRMIGSARDAMPCTKHTPGLMPHDDHIRAKANCRGPASRLVEWSAELSLFR